MSNVNNSPYKPTDRELVFLQNTNDITPIDNPLLPFDIPSTRRPRDYLPRHDLPFGKKVAEWQQEFYGLPNVPAYRTEPEITPMKPDAPTVVGKQRRPIDVYLNRIKTLAKMNHQTILYVTPEVADKVRAYRSDPWWIIIDEFPSMWKFPNNTYQQENFLNTQRQLFAEFDGWAEESSWRPNGAYDNGSMTATYNAKVFITYDAVMRNPFGSEKWAYFDAGLYDDQGPTDSEGVMWGELFREQLDEAKFERSISVSQDTGIVIGEYSQSDEYGCLGINHECFLDPKKAWLCLHFIANVWVGSSLGMLNYSVRFMQTVDDLDANRRYTGREEMVIPWVATRYPNTIFSIARVPGPPGMACANDYPMKWCYTTWGGPDTVPEIADPLETLFCEGYVSKRPFLAAGGLLDKKLGEKKDPELLNPHDEPLRIQFAEEKWAENYATKRDRLTYGVELEFAVAGLAPEFEDPAPNDPRSVRGVLGTARPDNQDKVNIRVLKYIASILTSYGIPAEAREGTPPSALNPIENPWTAKDPKSWIVTTDDSIEPTADGDYYFHKIEITSPAFYYGKTSLEAVSQVCGVLNSNLRIQLNDSMALHVHVGNGTKGFTTETVRGVMATAFTFEPQIEKIHPESFRGEYKYAPNLRDFSRLRNMQEWMKPSGTGLTKHEVFYREARYLTQSLNKILACDDIQEIADLTAYSRPEVDGARMAYNINYLVSPQPGTIGVEGSKKTIEFRQHEGTVDPRRVVNWIRFCVGLVEFADTCEPETLNNFLRRNIHDSLNIMNMGMICEALGMRRIGWYYHQIVGEAEHAVYWRNLQAERQYLDPAKWEAGWRSTLIGYNDQDGGMMVVHRPCP
ncbi:hypothetical protein HYFRA_00006735 [Hymenoscyphus fraxineus]|uniref:Uncharacterized protein n=1 Tax=Hymenoscyphus fraxineus TaxID=746836 RepID=A0A9N9PSW0_9HELO|nr:hypothetical protein HYFRA_00006735 [Hymenoscyphus fraxineus]